MRAVEILATLTAAGIRLTVDGDKLLASPAAALTDVHRDLIRQHKPELHAWLSEPRREWLVTDADGAASLHTFALAVTLGEVLSWYQGATVAPVPDPDQGTDLPPDVVQTITGWLDRLGEDCQTTRREVLERARDNPDARRYYEARAKPETPPGPNHEAPGPTGTGPQERKQ